jgi:hypothetical protein
MFLKENLSNDEILCYLHKCAIAYEKIVGKAFLFVNYSKQKDEFVSYEVFFQPFQFMHLTGINSKTMDAVGFYRACLANPIEIDISDCTPAYRHTRKEICSKIVALNELLDLTKARYFMVADKDKITEKVDFDFAYGKNSILGCVNGYNKRKIPYPITCINKNIEEFCTRPHKITFILSKDKWTDKYMHIFYEIKEGLTSELMSYPSFPENLKEKILM